MLLNCFFKQFHKQEKRNKILYYIHVVLSILCKTQNTLQEQSHFKNEVMVQNIFQSTVTLVRLNTCPI